MKKACRAKEKLRYVRTDVQKKNQTGWNKLG
jgi:hypothetical protein